MSCILSCNNAMSSIQTPISVLRIGVRVSLASSTLITILSPSLSECHNGSDTNAINDHLPAVPVCKDGRDANKRLSILLSLYQLRCYVAAAWPRLLRLLFLWRPQMSANAAGRGSVFLLRTGKM